MRKGGQVLLRKKITGNAGIICVPGFSPAGEGDAFCFPGYIVLSPASFPLSLAFSRSWEAGGEEWEKQPKVLKWRQCS